MLHSDHIMAMDDIMVEEEDTRFITLKIKVSRDICHDFFHVSALSLHKINRLLPKKT